MKFEKSCCLAATLAAVMSPLQAATVTLTSADALDTSSFSSFVATTPAGSWSSGAAPVAGNDYVVPILRLRTPADLVTEHTFAGDTLKITTANGVLTFKGGISQTITVPTLILDGGMIEHRNAFNQIFTLAGNLTITGSGSRISAFQGPIDVVSTIGGTGDLTIIDNLGTTFSGTNTWTGNLTVNGAFTLAATGTMAFKIGANGVNNTIAGTSTALFNGIFILDLSTAGTTVGDRWTLVNVGTLAETFGGAFVIDGFTEVNGVWTDGGGKYQFLESTGVLTVINPDTDGDGLPDVWEIANGLDPNSAEGDDGSLGDPDGDHANNLLEYLSVPSTKPNDKKSFPDTDGDGMGDGWELNFFRTLDQNPGDDFDNDYATNLSEYLADKDPADFYSYPDADNDGINDGWEIHFWPEAANPLQACNPDADSDGDLFSNLIEFDRTTDPRVQTSSPDTDQDGLPDGWEVRYFRIGTQDLDATLTHQDGAGDPDGDGYSNLAEYAAQTDPNSATSTPTALAYWRFEERTAGVVPVGDNTGGNQKSTVLDSSGLGNHMMTWRDYTSPLYSTAVPFAAVPLTSAANTASLNFVRDGTNLFITDNIYTTGGVELNSHVFNAFTIEASFNTNATNVWQVVIGKTGNPIAGQPPFSLKIRATDNKLVAGIVDGAGTAKEAVSSRAITTGTWFSTVVTASATELKIWVKEAADANYVLEGTTPIGGAFFNYAGVNSPWVIGLGKWNGADADPFGGNIDEVRISAKVLAPSEFLTPVVGGGTYATWAEANITDATKRGETADADGDGTSNLTEFRLGLAPNSATSRFAVTRGAAGVLTWPSAAGVTFSVQRSTTMAAGSWSKIATVPGTAGTATFTDLTPPTGSAFYRILLEP